MIAILCYYTFILSITFHMANVKFKMENFVETAVTLEVTQNRCNQENRQKTEFKEVVSENSIESSEKDRLCQNHEILNLKLKETEHFETSGINKLGNLPVKEQQEHELEVAELFREKEDGIDAENHHVSEKLNSCDSEVQILDSKDKEEFKELTNKHSDIENILDPDPNLDLNFLPFVDKLRSESEMFICPMCPRIFETKYKKESHLYKVHNLQKYRSKKVENKLKEENINGTWPPNVQELSQKVDGVKRFFCDQCPYESNRCDSMKKHLLRVHGKDKVVPQFQCEVCGKMFIDKAYLQNHSATHSTEPLYRCHVCGLGFHRQPSLKRHLESHSSEKQFACKLCSYQTNRKHLMYQHIKHHEVGRVFTCRVCGERHFTQIALRAHMYLHKQIGNKACSFCKVGFSSKERTLLHMKKAHFSGFDNNEIGWLIKVD